MSAMPEAVYPEFERLLTMPRTTESLTAVEVEKLVDLVRTTAPATSMSMRDRDKATGAGYTFAVHADLAAVVNYVYNHCITYFRKDFFEKTHNKIYI